MPAIPPPPYAPPSPFLWGPVLCVLPLPPLGLTLCAFPILPWGLTLRVFPLPLRGPVLCALPLPPFLWGLTLCLFPLPPWAQRCMCSPSSLGAQCCMCPPSFPGAKCCMRFLLLPWARHCVPTQTCGLPPLANCCLADLQCPMELPTGSTFLPILIGY
ncbi:hypothetical protein M422DRAFT_247904 [Sphaerobolus stellatus SS14]|nr:hypothetical protein M422DRAFT_247904 [Sphaerobolus stellatus SS14]